MVSFALIKRANLPPNATSRYSWAPLTKIKATAWQTRDRGQAIWVQSKNGGVYGVYALRPRFWSPITALLFAGPTKWWHDIPESHAWPPLHPQVLVICTGFLPLPLHTSCLALSKCFNLSKPQFPLCNVGAIKRTGSWGHCEKAHDAKVRAFPQEPDWVLLHYLLLMGSWVCPLIFLYLSFPIFKLEVTTVAIWHCEGWTN